MTPTTTQTNTQRGVNASQENSSMAERVARRIRQPQENALRYQLRPQLLPWVAGAAVAGASGLAAAAVSAAPLAAAGVLTAAWGVGAALLARLGHQCWWAGEAARWVRHHPVRTGVAVATAGAWSTVAIATGADHPHLVATTGLAGLYASAAHYWRSVRICIPTTTQRGHTPQAPVDTDDDTAFGEHVLLVWGLRLADGPLSRVGLSHHTPTTTGHEFRVSTPSGSKGLAVVTSNWALVETTLSEAGVAAEEITLHPTRDSRVATLRLTTRSPIAGHPGVPVTRDPDGRLHVMDRPLWNPDRGTLTLGVKEDLSDYVEWTLYPKDGMRGGAIIGASEGGKTGTVKLLIRGAYESDCTVVWHVDGQGGASIEGTSDYVDWEARTQAEWAEVLACATQAMDDRSESKSLLNWKFTPSRAHPGIMIIIDEAHNVLAHNPEAWTRLLREGRKVGIVPVLLTQNTRIGDSLGGGTLRDELGYRNVMFHRMKKAAALRLVESLQADPGALRAEPGWAVSPPEAAPTSGGNLTPWRVGNVAPLLDHEAGHQFHPVELDATTAQACTTAYHQRNSQTRQDITEAKITLRRAFEAGELSREEYRRRRDELTTTTTTVTIPDTAERTTEPEDTGQLDPFTAFLEPIQGLLMPVQEHDSAAELPPGQHEVLEALRAGHTSTARLVETTSLGRSGVHDALARLQKRGLVDRAQRGQYRIAA